MPQGVLFRPCSKMWELPLQSWQYRSMTTWLSRRVPKSRPSAPVLGCATGQLLLDTGHESRPNAAAGLTLRNPDWSFGRLHDLQGIQSAFRILLPPGIVLEM